MEAEKIISGISEAEIWEQINADLTAQPDLLSYKALIRQENMVIHLDIDIDPGGGFEGGIESTTLLSKLYGDWDYKFAIHHENFLDEIGKFFGMQDVVTGYPEFDNKVVVKTNDLDKTIALFEEAEIRETFQSLYDFTFGITKHKSSEDVNQYYLELVVDEGILEPELLHKIYKAFYKVLVLLTV